MRLERGVGFRQLRTCRRTRPVRLCAKNGNRPKFIRSRRNWPEQSARLRHARGCYIQVPARLLEQRCSYGFDHGRFVAPSRAIFLITAKCSTKPAVTIGLEPIPSTADNWPVATKFLSTWVIFGRANWCRCGGIATAKDGMLRGISNGRS
jgi:hypothetical protein